MPDNLVNLYETRRMLNILEQFPPAPTFLRNKFFRNTIQSDTDHIDIDLVKNKRRIVPYVRPIQQGVVIERGGFETNSYQIPYIKVKRESEADKYINRSAGETIYTTETPAQRAAKELVKDLADLNSYLDAEEERQAAEAIFTGKVTIRNEDGIPFQEVDFKLENIEVLAGTKKWSDSTQDYNEILEFLRHKRKSIVSTGAPSPTDLIVASDVGDVIIKKFNPSKDTSYLSSIRVDRGQLDIQNLPDGITYLGYFNELGVDIYSYDGTYMDLDGTVKSYAPDGMIAMLSSNARFDRNYAAIKNFYNMAAVPRFPHSWITEDGSARFLQLESAPLYAVHQVDSIAIAKVL